MNWVRRRRRASEQRRATATAATTTNETRELNDLSNRFTVEQQQQQQQRRSSFVSARNLFCGTSTSNNNNARASLEAEPSSSEHESHPQQPRLSQSARETSSSSSSVSHHHLFPSNDVASVWMQMGSSSPAALSSTSKPVASVRQSVSTTAGRSGETNASHSKFGAKTEGSHNNTSNSTTVASSIHQYSSSNQRAIDNIRSQISSRRRLEQNKNSKKMGDWKSAVDPKSGRTYYYNTKTRETQWRKPIELATPQEIHAMQVKERKQKEFFAAMEANILKSMSKQNKNKRAVPASSPDSEQEDIKRSSEREQESTNSLLSDSDSSDEGSKVDGAGLLTERPNDRLVRTISAMPDTLLRQIIQRQPSCRAIPDPNVEQQSATMTTTSQSSITVEALVVPSRDDSQRQSSSAGFISGSSSLDFSLSSSTEFQNMADESSADLGLTAQESHALQKLAQTAKTMARVSETAIELEYSDDSEEDEMSPQPRGPICTPDAETPPGLAAMVRGEPSIKKLSLSTRRNSCGTMYVGSTLSAPDCDATIKCVCGVFRAHILSAAQEDRKAATTNGQYRSFCDRSSDRKSRRIPPGRDELMIMRLSLREKPKHDQPPPPVPSLDEITSFYRAVFRKAQMETDTIIMSLIYVERLIKSTRGALRPQSDNWRSLLLSCMILSSKVWDDLSMWNADFSQCAATAGVKFPLQRINELEIAVLTALQYKVKVPSSEYAKYYFVLRSMLIKSGLGGDDLTHMSPLDVEGAKRLEQISSSFQSAANTKRRVAIENSLRSKSLGVHESEERRKAQSGRALNGHEHIKASLEHVVKMSME